MSRPAARKIKSAASPIVPETPEAGDASLVPPAIDNAEDTAADSPPSEDSPAPPTDAAGWRAYIGTLPSKDILRIIQQDKGRAMRLLTGFRPGGDAVRHPIVLQRMVDEAVKQVKFAEALWEIRPAPVSEAPSSPKIEKTTSAPLTPTRTDEAAPALREALKKQRAALKEKDAHLAELEARVSALTKERDAARAEIEAAQTARRTAEAQAERERRQRERDARREAVRAVVKAEETPAAKPALVAPTVTVASEARPFEEAVRRLLNRGKYSVVAEVCKEALQTDAATSSGVRGTVHSLYAAALYGMDDPSAEEQDRLAATALLDGGRITAAAEAMARLLARAHGLKASDTATLRRLLLLAERHGEAGAVQEVFTRMRIGSPEGGRRLRQALGSGGKKSDSLIEAAFGAREDTIILGPDEAIALPVTDPAAASVTPRRVARAVDTGEAAFIAEVRAGLAALRARGGQDARLADALLEAITVIEAVAVAPLLAEENHPVLVDASNVARHNPDPLALTPTLKVANLLRMRDYLLRQGFFPVLLVADANLGFHVDDREQYRVLVNRQIIREALSGTSADETLLREARTHRAPLISNDTFKEWGEAALGIERYGFFINGGRVALTHG
jgi:hypothetical protein